MKEILLVEATPALLTSRIKTLEKEGYHVIGASTSGELAQQIRHGSYDLLIVDAEVPEVLGMLPSEIPTLMIINEQMSNPTAYALPVGLWGLLIKPFTASEFKRAVAEAIERAEAVKDAMQQRVLLTLNNTSQLLLSEAEMEKFFSHILEITAAETEADSVSVLTVDKKTNQLRVKAKLGLELSATYANEKIGQWVMKMSKALLVNSKIEADSHLREIMFRIGASSLLSVPLVSRDRVIGVINGVKLTPGARFTSSNLDFLSILARQVAVATENAGLFHSVQEQRLQLEKSLEKVLQGQESERKRVAIEIHDGIGQQMVGILYRLQALDDLLSESRLEEARAEASEIEVVLKGAVKELRGILAGLRPNTLDELGLVSSLYQEVIKLNEETDTRCYFQVEGAPIGLNSNREAAIYRVVQEALTNIRRHANATEADVLVRFESGAVSVKVSDNGMGFKLDQANNGILLGHLGLLGMKERAEMLGGDLSVNTGLGRGTSVLLTLPEKS